MKSDDAHPLRSHEAGASSMSRPDSETPSELPFILPKSVSGVSASPERGAPSASTLSPAASTAPQVATPTGGVTDRPWEHKQTVRCVFCMGAKCKRCGKEAYTLCEKPAIDMIHSSYIVDDVIAMQRPSDEHFINNRFVEQLRERNVVAVFNLQEPGEHASCGFGINSSGFSYYPEKLMQAGIKHFNYSWPDMETPSVGLMFDIVRIALNELKHGKIAVHCHAGFGRTGIAIASILIARHGWAAHKTIELIRAKRPGSVQTVQQQVFVFEFKSAFENMQLYYPSVADSSSLSATLKTFGDSVADQHYCLPAEELTEYSKVPKPVALALKMLHTAINVNPVIAAHFLIGVHPSLVDRAKALQANEPIFPPNVDVDALKSEESPKKDSKGDGLPQIDVKKSNNKSIKLSFAYRAAHAPLRIPAGEWISENEITFLKRQANEGQWHLWKRTSASSAEESILQEHKALTPTAEMARLPSTGASAHDPTPVSIVAEKPPVVMGYSNVTSSRPTSPGDGNRSRKNSALSNDSPLTRESSRSDLGAKSGVNTAGTTTPTGEPSTSKPLSRVQSRKALMHQPSMDDMVSTSIAREERENERKLLTLNKSKRNIFDDSVVVSSGSPKAANFARKTAAGAGGGGGANGASANDLTGYLELLENQEQHATKEHARAKLKAVAHNAASSEVGGIFLGGILLLDWLESRADPIFDEAFISLLSDSWIALHDEQDELFDKTTSSSPSRAAPLAGQSTTSSSLPSIVTNINVHRPAPVSSGSSLSSMAKKLRSPFASPSTSKEFSSARSAKHERQFSTHSIVEEFQPLDLEFLDAALRRHISKCKLHALAGLVSAIRTMRHGYTLGQVDQEVVASAVLRIALACSLLTKKSGMSVVQRALNPLLLPAIRASSISQLAAWMAAETPSVPKTDLFGFSYSFLHSVRVVFDTLCYLAEHRWEYKIHDMHKVRWTPAPDTM